VAQIKLKKKKIPVAGGESWDVTPGSPFLVEILGLAKDEFVPVFLIAGPLLPTFSSCHFFASMSRGLQFYQVYSSVLVQIIQVFNEEID